MELGAPPAGGVVRTTPEETLALAREAAGDLDVRLGGVSVYEIIWPRVSSTGCTS